MRRYKTNSRQGLCNLFAEYVSEEISQNGKYETMISVSDCDTLILIKGYTKREDIVDVKDIVNKFISTQGFTFGNGLSLVFSNAKPSHR